MSSRSGGSSCGVNCNLFEPCRASSSIPALQAGHQLESENKSIQRSMATLQSTTRQVNHLERAHDAVVNQQNGMARGLQAVTRCASLAGALKCRRVGAPTAIPSCPRAQANTGLG